MLIDNPMDSKLAFPILECFHILGFALAVGSIALVDFRLLGFGLRRQDAASLVKETGMWMLIGLSTSIFAGMMLYTTDPDKYFLSPFFIIKMICLVVAIVFNYTLHRKAARPRTPPGQAKVIASVSLMLWASVIVGGMWVSFFAGE